MEKSLEKKLRKRFYHIKERCNNINCKSYWRYGWRWIRCERELIEDFIKDMWPSFEEHVNKYWINETTIDRIDVNWNYCKENCRRATWKEQGKNRRECRQFDYDWKHFETLRDLANYVWLPEDSIRYRLNAWRDLKDAVETEIINNKIWINYNWVYYESIWSLCSQLWLSWKIVYNRLRSWWSIEEAIWKIKKESKHAIEYKWQKFNSLKELAKQYNVPYWTIKRRVRSGYTWDELIEWKMIEYRWKKYKTAMDIAKEYWISKQAIYCRVFKWKELTEAIDDALNYKQSKCTHSQITPSQKSIQQERTILNI
jgi:Zn-dependent peptidase ImmA (M78 family)